VTHFGTVEARDDSPPRRHAPKAGWTERRCVDWLQQARHFGGHVLRHSSSCALAECPGASTVIVHHQEH
jgi:hypothetical protein